MSPRPTNPQPLSPAVALLVRTLTLRTGAHHQHDPEMRRDQREPSSITPSTHALVPSLSLADHPPYTRRVQRSLAPES